MIANTFIWWGVVCILVCSLETWGYTVLACIDIVNNTLLKWSVGQKDCWILYIYLHLNNLSWHHMIYVYEAAVYLVFTRWPQLYKYNLLVIHPVLCIVSAVITWRIDDNSSVSASLITAHYPVLYTVLDHVNTNQCSVAFLNINYPGPAHPVSVMESWPGHWLTGWRLWLSWAETVSCQ